MGALVRCHPGLRLKPPNNGGGFCPSPRGERASAAMLESERQFPRHEERSGWRHSLARIEARSLRVRPLPRGEGK